MQAVYLNGPFKIEAILFNMKSVHAMILTHAISSMAHMISYTGES